MLCILQLFASSQSEMRLQRANIHDQHHRSLVTAMTANTQPAQQLRGQIDDTHVDSATLTQPRGPISRSSQQLSHLPPPLLTLTACHLDVVALFRLQRCSTRYRRLCADESYRAAVWRWAQLRMSMDKRLHEWTLPSEQCVASGERGLIPVSLWQLALPVWRAVVARLRAQETVDGMPWLDVHEGYDRYIDAVEEEQPTVTILAKRNADDSWEAVDEDTKQSADVQRVEVLRDIDWCQMDEVMLPCAETGVRCRLVLQACPYLQHLDLTVDTRVSERPSHADTFALVPRLRSLRLNQQCDRKFDSGFDKEALFDFRAMLTSLPHLTSLTCTNIIFSGVTELLDIASHSTLEELHIDCKIEAEWVKDHVHFPISVDEDEQRLERDAARVLSLRAGMYGVGEDHEAVWRAVLFPIASIFNQQDKWLTAETQRLTAAVTRTHPTQRSCEVRLALADWLHRHLQRDSLDTNALNNNQFVSMLRRWRALVAHLRSTLQHQLSELSEVIAEPPALPAHAPPSDSSLWGLGRANKRACVRE